MCVRARALARSPTLSGREEMPVPFAFVTSQRADFYNSEFLVQALLDFVVFTCDTLTDSPSVCLSVCACMCAGRGGPLVGLLAVCGLQERLHPDSG